MKVIIFFFQTINTKKIHDDDENSFGKLSAKILPTLNTFFSEALDKDVSSLFLSLFLSSKNICVKSKFSPLWFELILSQHLLIKRQVP